MAYTSNPHVWKARQLAVNDVLVRGFTKAAVARKYGVTRSTVCKWVKRAPKQRNALIYTLPSRPHFHPNSLPLEVVTRVINLRKKTKRCAPVLHTMLKTEGITISLSSFYNGLLGFGATVEIRLINFGKKA